MTMPATAPDRLQWFFEELSRTREDALRHLPEVFTEDLVFWDPFRSTRTPEDFRILFERMFRRYRGVRFTNYAWSGSEDAFTLTYSMHLRMAVGPEFVSQMASVSRAREGRVFELRDYYDFAGSLVSPSGALQRAYRGVVRACFL